MKDYIVEFGTEGAGVRFPRSDGSILHIKAGESIEISYPSYFPPPWNITDNPEKTDGWIEFQKAMRKDPGYYTQWIDVKERLPKEDGEYLTYVMDNGCTYGQYIQRFFLKERCLEGMYSDQFTHWEKVQWDDYVVTHWMKLPEPPHD